MTGPGCASKDEFRRVVAASVSDPEVVDMFLTALMADENDEAVYGWSAEQSDPENAASSQDAGPAQSTAISRGTVLVVDDEDLVRSMIATMMEDAGFDVMEARDGLEALTFLERNGADIAALVSDIKMPGIDGLELTRRVAERWPGVALVLVSGYPTDGRMSDVPEAAVFVPKPFRLDDLAHAVGRTLAHKGH
jgi:CheY-like chemotaxis protein